MDTVIEIKPPIENIKPPLPKRNIEIGTTQHFPDFKDADITRMREVCKKAKETGADSLRWNFRWNKVIDENGDINMEGITHYEEALEVIKNEGLSNTLVISDPPESVKELARRGNKEEFFKEFQRYMDLMHDAFKKTGASPKTIQVENELNTGMYNNWIRIGEMNKESQFGLDDLNQMLTAVREYFPTADRAVNVQVSNITATLKKIPRLGKIHPLLSGVSTQSFVSELMQKCGNSFEVLGLDYYPGLYWIDRLGKNMFKDMWTNMQPIKWVMDKAADRTDEKWGTKKISLSEFGFLSTPTERTQRAFYVFFLRSLDQLIGGYEKLQVEDPDKWRQPVTSIVTYQAMEEKDDYTPAIMRPLGVFTLEGKAKGVSKPKSQKAESAFKPTSTADVLKRIFETRFK